MWHRRVLVLLGVFTLAAARPILGLMQSSPAHPTVDQVLDAYVAALGGRPAIQATTSMLMRGTVTAPGLGASGTIETYAKAPNKQLTDFAGGALGAWRVGFDGTTGWRQEDGQV